MRISHRAALSFAVAIVLSVGSKAAPAEDDVPKPMAFARYQQMLDRSPFAVATAVAPPATAPDFAKDLYIANAAHSPDGDLITLASNADKNFKKYLTTSGTVDGFGVSNVEWSDRVGETKVTITKDGQFATLGFNQALLTQPIQNQTVVQQSMPQPNMPPGSAMPVPNPQIMRPAPIPSIPTPPPHVRGVIRREGAPAAPVRQVPQPQPVPVPETPDDG
jgi:hypothetical protein